MAPPHTTTWAKSTVPGRPSGSRDRGPDRPAAVEHEAVDAVVGEQAGPGGGGPRQVRLGHAAPAAGRGVGAVGVHHPAGDLLVAPAELGGAAAQRLAGRRLGARARSARTARARPRRRWRRGRPSVEVGDAVLVAPAGEDVLGRPAVEPAVDLGAAAGAAALGVGDGREAERGGHAAGAVLAVHLLERERHDLALAHERALLEHEDVEAGLGQQRRGRRAAGAGADDQHLGLRARCRSSRRGRSLRRRAAGASWCPATSPRRRRRRASGRGGRTRRTAGAGGGRGRATMRRPPASRRQPRRRRRRRRPTPRRIGDGRPSMRRPAKATTSARRSAGRSGRSWATSSSQNSAIRPWGGNVGIGRTQVSSAPPPTRGTTHRPIRVFAAARVPAAGHPRTLALGSTGRR